jgi:hypothetical protein
MSKFRWQTRCISSLGWVAVVTRDEEPFWARHFCNSEEDARDRSIALLRNIAWLERGLGSTDDIQTDHGGRFSEDALRTLRAVEMGGRLAFPGWRDGP